MESNIYKSPESKLKKEEKDTSLKLTSKTLFKLIFISYFFGLGSILLIGGIYNLITGSESIITFNREHLSGLPGFIGTLIFIPIFSLFMSCLHWVFMILGLWILNLIKGPVTLEYKK